MKSFPTWCSVYPNCELLDLIKAVPAEHKKFLADMVWVHEEDNVCINTEEGIKQCKLIAVHAGLEKNRGVEEQLKYLKARDTRIPKVEALSGRKNVWEMPKVPYVGLNFAVYESLKDWLVKSRPFGLVEDTELGVTTKLACGAAAGTVG